MRAADLTEAMKIVSKLEALNKEACALELNVTAAGVRIADSAQTYVTVPPSAHAEIVAIAKRHVAAQQAALRRRAAQIGLVL